MKIFTKMFFVVAVTTMFAFAANAQIVIIDDFGDYAAGDSLELTAPADSDAESDTEWYLNRKSSNQDGLSPVIVAGGLSYDGYIASDMGNSVMTDTVGMGKHFSTRHFIDSTTDLKVYANKLYVSCLVKFDTAGNARDVFSLETNSNGGNFSRGRVFSKLEGDSLQFGIGVKSTATDDAFSSVICELGETVLLVLEYSYDGVVDDALSGDVYDDFRLFVNPDLSKSMDDNVSVSNTELTTAYNGGREWLGMNIVQSDAAITQISGIAWADQWDALAAPELATIIIDDFSDYAAGDSLELTAPADSDAESDTEWYLNRKSSNQDGLSPVIVAGGLSYDGYIASDMGNSVMTDTVGMGKHFSTRHFIDSTTDIKVYANKLYVSCLVNFDTAGNARDVFSLETNSNGGNFSRGRVFSKLEGDSLQFGIGVKSTATDDAFSSVICELGETVLLVLEYSYDGVVDDALSGDVYDDFRLFVNPDLSKSADANVSVSNTELTTAYNGGREWLGMNIVQSDATITQISGIAWTEDWAELSDGSTDPVLDTNADLSMITIDDVNLEGFDSDTLSYDYELATGTTTIPVVLGTTFSSSATWMVQATATAIGEATILKVTAEDMETTKTYTVNFVAEVTAVADNALEAGSIYPNPSNGTFTIDNYAGSDVVIYAVTGQVVYQVNNISNNEAINTDLNKGVYIVAVANANSTKVTRIIVE